MNLDLIRVPPAMVGDSRDLQIAHITGSGAPDLAPALRETPQLIKARNRLKDYALTIGSWPTLN